MKPKLSAWLQDKLDRYKRKKELPFPRLPDPRPHALTPSPSQEILPQECLFFKKLPYELRRQILIQAFGKDRLHMDLSFEHPPAPYAPGQPRERDHAGVHATNGGCGKYPRLDHTQPKSWIWWSSICHRYFHPPDRDGRPGPMSGGWGPQGPWEDYCRYGYAAYCDEWPGHVPFKCRVGVMGWLLSCRQAYEEGVDVLYKTNCVCMSSEVMITHLPELLLPQRLAAMTSLEISWPLKCCQKGDQIPTLKEGHLETLFTLIPLHFDNLSCLYIALQPTDGMALVNKWLNVESVLTQFDGLVQQMPGLVECCIALPESVFTDLLYPMLAALRVKYPAPARLRWLNQIWRFLDGKHVVAEPQNNTYPNPPHRSREVDGAKSSMGYWIVQGGVDEGDMSGRMAMQGCFGSSGMIQ